MQVHFPEVLESHNAERSYPWLVAWEKGFQKSTWSVTLWRKNCWTRECQGWQENAKVTDKMCPALLRKKDQNTEKTTNLQLEWLKKSVGIQQRSDVIPVAYETQDGRTEGNNAPCLCHPISPAKRGPEPGKVKCEASGSPITIEDLFSPYYRKILQPLKSFELSLGELPEFMWLNFSREGAPLCSSHDPRCCGMAPSWNQSHWQNASFSGSQEPSKSASLRSPHYPSTLTQVVAML